MDGWSRAEVLALANYLVSQENLMVNAAIKKMTEEILRHHKLHSAQGERQEQILAQILLALEGER